MDELSALLQKLEAEVGALEELVDRQHGEEQKQLAEGDERVKAATSRIARARATLFNEGAAIRALEQRRTELLARIESWRGQLWKIGYGAMVMGLFAGAIIPVSVAAAWLGLQWALGLGLGQLAAFALAYFLIPEKR